MNDMSDCFCVCHNEKLNPQSNFEHDRLCCSKPNSLHMNIERDHEPLATHYACPEKMAKFDGHAPCCGCTNHVCHEEKEDSELDHMVRDFTALGACSKSEVRRRIVEYAAEVSKWRELCVLDDAIGVLSGCYYVKHELLTAQGEGHDAGISHAIQELKKLKE